jgi:hypothetical protein
VAVEPRADGLGDGEAAHRSTGATTSAHAATGPLPAARHGRYRYSFGLHAFDSHPDLRPGAGKGELVRHALAEAELIGTYQR